MAVFAGNIDKMEVAGTSPVSYTLPIGAHQVDMNALIGKKIRLHWGGKINCVECGKPIKKSYGQGFCYDDFMNAPDNAECIMRPELCRGHLGEGRDAAWEFSRHVQEHYVYLALTSAVKVGVTRNTQVPTRWIDQGAWKAIKLAKVPYRKLAGLIETELKQHVTDKTNWQQMLRNEMATGIDLAAEKARISQLLPPELAMYICEENEVTEITYPVNLYPQKVQSISLDKQPVIEEVLAGIRGQYLIFADQSVINLRSHAGYYLELEA